ncbi:MAG: ABC transporter permease subunit [Lachnospiraceae bacterium]|nr:ABC transporter permease subunit [Lachnospiraceae bacterium]
MERLKNIRINPIVKKDLRVLSRSMKIAWGLFAYEAVLLIAFLFAIWIIFEEFSGYGYSADYQAFVVMFPVISVLEFGIIALLMPIMTATAVSGEKERQTFDILLTTVMTPRAIIRGKVASAVIRVMVFMVGSIPLMALSFTLGGLSWINLFITMIAFLIFAILTGSLGIFASTLTTKSITGIILTYVFYFVYANASFVPTLIILFASGFSSSSSVSFLLLLNPVSAITQMFALMLGGNDLFGAGMSSSITGWIWVALSGASMIGFSILFQELAARRIDPLCGYVKDTKKKKQPSVTLDRPQPKQMPENWAPGQENAALDSQNAAMAATMAAVPQNTAPMAQPIAPTAQPIAPEAQPITPEVQSITPAAQPIAPTAQPIDPAVQTIAPTMQPITPEIQSITPEAQPMAPTVQPIAPEAQPIATETQPIATETQPTGNSRNDNSTFTDSAGGQANG